MAQSQQLARIWPSEISFELRGISGDDEEKSNKCEGCIEYQLQLGLSFSRKKKPN